MEEKKLPPIIKEKISEYYGLDVSEAKMYFSTRNYAFVFPDGKTVLRASVTATAAGRGNALSEILWVDELRRYSSTICAPIPSNRNNHIEEFSDGKATYRVARFEQAQGSRMSDAANADNWFYMHLGDTIGRIHRASKEAAEAGIHYQRQEWQNLPLFKTETATSMNDEVKKKCQEIIDKVLALPISNDNYGMVHGDLGINNYYMDINNIWVFDFDDCCYNHYMYDIATVLGEWLFTGKNKPEVARRKLLYESGMLENFKMGYERHIQLPEEEWEQLELFMKLRFVYVNIILNAMDTSSMISDVASMQKMMAMLVTSDDLLGALDKMVQLMAKMQFTNYTKSTVEREGTAEIAEKDDLGTVVSVTGKMDSNTSEDIQKKIMDIIDSGCEKLTLDCAQMSYMSSAGIRVLIASYKKLGNKFQLRNVPENVQEVLNITGLSEYFKEEEA